MKCAHCGIAFHANSTTSRVTWGDRFTGWNTRVTRCPACSDFIIELGKSPDNGWEGPNWRMIYPVGANRGPVPTEVPLEIAQVYIEACNVLPISPKASAALSRRCLQNVLHQAEYKGNDLAKQVKAFLDEQGPTKAAPQSLKDTVDAIRNFGNFSAHPINDLTSLQIIDVEPEEAEWCLEILEEMFQHFYVRPAIAQARKAALNKKLESAGKPASK